MAHRDIEEFFVNELTVLNFDKRLSNHKRHKRFIQLIDKTLSAPATTRLEGSLEGSNLLWVSARFDQDCVQLNVFNKLKLEIKSKLTSSIKVESIELITNVPKQNKIIDLMQDGQPFSITKFNPIKVERDFFVQDNLT